MLDYSQICDIYCNLSHCYHSLENFTQAIKYAEKSLEHAKITLDDRLKAKSLHNLGMAYFHLKIDDKKAISYLDEAISIAQRIQDYFLIGRIIGNWGSIYSQFGMYEEAYKMYQQRLDIAISRQDKQGEAIVCCNIGNLLQKIGDGNKGREYLEKAINISKQIQDKQTEAQSYYFLGLIFEKIDDKTRAIDLCKQAHSLAQVLSSPLVHECQKLMERLTTHDLTSTLL